MTGIHAGTGALLDASAARPGPGGRPGFGGLRAALVHAGDIDAARV
ncbi:hypothetical protein [Streptomyces longisporus]